MEGGAGCRPFGGNERHRAGRGRVVRERDVLNGQRVIAGEIARELSSAVSVKEGILDRSALEAGD